MKSLAAVLFFSVASAGPIPTASSTGPWVVDFNERHCVASRQYDVAGGEYLLAIQPLPTQEETRVYVEAPQTLRALDFSFARIFVGQRKVKDLVLKGVPVARPGHARFTLALKRDEFQDLSKSGLLTVAGERVRATFPITQLAAVNQQLDRCVSLLLESWGLSAEAQAKIAKFPKPAIGPSPSFTSDDYPQSAVFRGANGDVEAVLNIDKVGKPIKCQVILQSGYPDLDTRTCPLLMERGRHYQPARDRDGNPVPSPTLVMINWRM